MRFFLSTTAFMRGLLTLLAFAPLLAHADTGLWFGVDLNRDGIIQLTEHPRIPSDRTGADQPFVFWVNRDQDDLPESETWPVERPDYSTEDIDSVKDLEDLYPLRIQWPEGIDPVAAALSFSLASNGDAAFNLFLAVDQTCTNQHLLDTDTAKAQLEAPYRTRLGRISAAAPLTLPADTLPRSAIDGSICLLLEGAATGQGVLKLSLQSSDDASRLVDSVHFDLRDVKSLYERTRIDWPEHVSPAWTYTDRQPPDPNLYWVEDPQGIGFDPPWYEDEHVIVWVYGWQTEGDAGYLSATVRGGETIFKRLWHRGYRGRLVFLHWPTVKPKLGYGLFQSEYRAYKAGPALKDLVAAQPTGRSIHVTAHSLGNVILLEALKLGMRAEDAMFQVGAIPAGAIDPRDLLILPEAEEILSPDFADEYGYRGYLAESPVRLYNMYNPNDHTWIGWNLAQHLMKPTHEKGARYRYYPEALPEQRYVLEYLSEDTGSWASRPVQDPHEIMAFIARSKTQAVGGEARLRGPVEHTFDIGRPPYSFGHGHTVGWSWPPQRTTDFFNLLLDAFNIAYKSPQR
jgi:hypothetical protein